MPARKAKAVQHRYITLMITAEEMEALIDLAYEKNAEPGSTGRHTPATIAAETLRERINT